jgi:hypothetical protein
MSELEYRLLQNQIFIMTHLQDLVGRKRDLEAAIGASERLLTAHVVPHATPSDGHL